MNKQQMLARMDPQLRGCYEAMQPYSIRYDSLCAIRAYSLSQTRISQSASVIKSEVLFQKIEIRSEQSEKNLELRIYTPAVPSECLPVILYFHGGGGVMSSAEQDDSFCLNLALRERSVVVSVEYRLAPEHPAPAGQLDCYAAWLWLCGEGLQILNVDLNRSAFYGGSGGGNMALGVALRLLDHGGRLPALLLPLYPMIDDRGITHSSHEITDSSLWGREQNLQAWNYYINGLTGEASQEIDSYIAPARRDDFAGLPPVFTFVGELDLFRDETLDFVQKLCCCDVPVEFSLYPGCYHGFEIWAPEAEISKYVVQRIHQCLQHIFYPQAVH